VLWDVGDLNVIVERLSELLKLLLEGFSLSGLLEALGTSLETLGLSVGDSLLPCFGVGLVPFGSLKLLVLVSNIIELIFELCELGIVNVESLIVVIDGSIKRIANILPFLDKSLSLRRSDEFLVESLKGIDLHGPTPSLKGFTEVSDGSRMLNFIPCVLNISPFLLDGFLVMNSDLEEVHVLLPLFWYISDLDVLLNGMIKILQFSIKHFSFLRVFESLKCILNFISLRVSGGSFPSSVVSLVPLGTFELLVLVSNIIELIRDIWDSRVSDVDSSLSLNNRFMESLTEVIPLLHESLSFWGGEEFLIELLKVLNLLGL